MTDFADIDVATALIWMLRIILPIILFHIYFRYQAPQKDEIQYKGSTKNQYRRNKLLAHRMVTLDHPVPDSMSTMRRISQEEAPELFESSGKGNRRRGTQERRERPERADRGRREGKQRGEAEDPLPVSPADLDETPVAKDMVSNTFTVMPEENHEEESKRIEKETDTLEDIARLHLERMRLESFLNYLVFNCKGQQRRFLDEAAPPPPPPRPAPKGDAAVAPSGNATSVANEEAQLVLAGAIRFRRSDVARRLHTQLDEQQVEVSRDTFVMMIETCILASDLKAASDFLMKMEAAGHSPDVELLDRVMHLYSEKKRSDRDKKEEDSFKWHEEPVEQKQDDQMTTEPETTGKEFRVVEGEQLQLDTLLPGAVEEPTGERTSLRKLLNKEASAFVPNYTPQQYIPEQRYPEFESYSADPYAAETYAENYGANMYSEEPYAAYPDQYANQSWNMEHYPDQYTEAAFGSSAFPEPFYTNSEDLPEAHLQGGSANGIAEAPITRTSLKATSKPFQPQGTVKFDPMDHTWTVDTAFTKPTFHANDGSGKGRGK